MSKRSFFLIAALLLCIAVTKSQTIKTVGATGADYSTLKIAFDAVNDGTISGIIEFQIIDNTIETATAVLNSSGSGSASYTSISIYPTVTGKTISGNLASDMIQLNGADNVTIDGRLNRTGSSVNLTINNTNTGGSAISLIEGAMSNIIKYNLLKSAGLTSAQATVFFSTSTISGGNSNNTIEYNSFTGSTTRCMTAIGSLGSAAPNDNVNNTIDNNLFYDMLSFPAFATTSTGFAAIRIRTNSSAWTLTNNKFYETTAVATDMNFSGTIRASLVNINVASTGGSFTISNNYFGGSAADGTGMFTKAAGGFSTNFVNFDVIYINSSAVANLTSSIQGNTCKNMIMTNCFGGSLNFLNIAGGAVDVGTVTGNIIGSATDKGVLQVLLGSCMVDPSVDAGTLSGILISSTTGTVNIQNNTIGGLASFKSSQNSKGSVNGIMLYNLSSVTGPTVTIYNNTIGADRDSSFEITTGLGNMRGIYIGTPATVHIRNNTIQKTYSNTSTSGIQVSNGTAWIRNNVVKNLVNTTTGSMTGIQLNANGGISGNTVFNLTDYAVGEAVKGIDSYGQNNTDTGLVYNNFVYNLKADTSDVNILGITGIYSVAKLKNNVVVLDQNNKALNVGIYSLSPYVLHNTVYVTGTQTGFHGGSGAGSLTTAFFSGNVTVGVPGDIRNNIFVNTRVNAAGVTVKHYAIGMKAPLTGLISDYNVYFAPNANGVLGFSAINSSNPFSTGDKTTLTAWQAYTLQDCHSYNEDPGFTNPSVTSSVGSYLPTNTGISAYPFIQTWLNNYSVPVDYYGNSRGNKAIAPSATGAIEYATTPRPGYTAPFINTISKVSLGDSATITISGPGLGLITTVPYTNPAYFFYYQNGGVGPSNYKVSNVTVLSDTSFKFNVPQAKNFDTAFLFNLTIKMCGSATSGYSYMPGSTPSFVVNSLFSTLPVQWQSFTAKKQTSNHVLLNWVTTAEQDAQDFVVQHSATAQNWKEIGVVAAAGNSNVLNRYQFVHTQPFAGNNYYRLLQRDKNGRSSYSEVEVIQLADGITAFTIAGNAISDRQLRVYVAIPTTLRLFTSNGQLLQQFRLTQGNHTITLNEYSKGIYFINGQGKTERLIIQ